MIRRLNNINRLTKVFLPLIFIISAISCGDTESRRLDYKIKVTDFRGKTIQYQKPAKRVVCLIESALSGIYMLQASESLVGIPTSVYDGNTFRQYSVLDPRINKKEIAAPGNWDFVNLESLLSLQPDLVIIWASQKEAIYNIESNNISVYAVMLESINDVYKEISDLGILFDKTSRADSLISYTKNELVKLNTEINPAQKRKVYFMWSQGLLETSGKTSVVNEVIEFAGCENVCMDEVEHSVVNVERIIDWNPEIIVMWYNEKINTNDVLKEPAIKNISAIKSKKIFELPSVFYCDLWTLKFQYVAKLLAKWSSADDITSIDLEKDREVMCSYLYGKQFSKLLP